MGLFHNLGKETLCYAMGDYNWKEDFTVLLNNPNV